MSVVKLLQGRRSAGHHTTRDNYELGKPYIDGGAQPEVPFVI